MSTIDTLPQTARPNHPLDLTAKQIGIAVVRLVVRVLVDGARTVYACQERASQKRALFELDQRMLKDLGLTQSDVENAFNAPLWHRLGQ